MDLALDEEIEKYLIEPSSLFSTAAATPQSMNSLRSIVPTLPEAPVVAAMALHTRQQSLRLARHGDSGGWSTLLGQCGASPLAAACLQP